MAIAIDVKLCYGCRICELACSFHHSGGFSPELSSIKVARNNQNGEVQWSVDSTCDSCRGKEQPLCLAYCVYEAIKEADSE